MRSAFIQSSLRRSVEPPGSTYIDCCIDCRTGSTFLIAEHHLWNLLSYEYILPLLVTRDSCFFIFIRVFLNFRLVITRHTIIIIIQSHFNRTCIGVFRENNSHMYMNWCEWDSILTSSIQLLSHLFRFRINATPTAERILLGKRESYTHVAYCHSQHVRWTPAKEKKHN